MPFRVYLCISENAVISCGGGGGGSPSGTSNGSNTATNTNNPVQSPTNVPWTFVSFTGSTVTGGSKFSNNGYTGVFVDGRTITINNFIMLDYEITQAEFQATMEVNPSHFNGTSGKEAATGETQANGPDAPPSGSSRVCRDGCYENLASDCSTAYRRDLSPNLRGSRYLGFRVCRTTN